MVTIVVYTGRILGVPDNAQTDTQTTSLLPRR